MFKKEKNSNVTIVGLGQIGLMFLEQLSNIDDLSLSGVGRDHQLDSLRNTYPNTTFFSLIDQELISNSDLFIISVGRKGLPKVIKDMKMLIDNSSSKTTFLLIQNGVLSNSDIALGTEQSIVRGSVFTVVTSVGDEIKYKKSGLKISLANIQGNSGSKVQELLLEAGFKSETLDSWRDMEVSKLLMNTLGTTGVVTGLSLSDTFLNKDLFELEVRAMRDRMALIKAANLELYNFWNLAIPAKLLGGIFQYIPLTLLNAARGKLGKVISGERGNELSSAATQVNQGSIPKELDNYHTFFLSLAEEFGMSSPVDSAIVDIVQNNVFQLQSMSITDRIKLLLSKV